MNTYDQYRRRIADELGTDPGFALQALHQRLLRGETLKKGVAHEPNALLGRDSDIAAVTNLLRESRVTSIIGPGGMGKTRLAHAVSREAEYHVYFVSLAGVATDTDVEDEVVAAVGEQRLNSLESALLVLDNCEHVLDGAGKLAQELVSASKDLRILTTSRARLGLSSETVYPLSELPLPAAVELFSQRAKAVRPGVDLPSGAVKELCTHLDGLPLAIELAAAKARVMSIPEIASRLDDRFTLLRGGSRDAPDRHRTLHGVVDWSWNLLDEAGKQAMLVLSVFPAGFSYAAAEHVGVEETVENLVDQSLLKVHDTPAGARFQMLETVREFAAAQRSGDEVDRFLAWARDFCLTHHELLFGPDPLGSVFPIDVEQDNLIAALRYGIKRADGPTVAATAAVLTCSWLLVSHYSRTISLADDITRVLLHYRPEAEHIEVTRTAAAVCAATTFMIQGPRALRSLIVLKRLPSVKPDTLPKAIAAYLINQDSQQPLAVAATSFVASYIKESELDPHAALAAARQAQELVENETPWLRIATHARVGDLLLQIGQPEEAETHYLAALHTLETDVSGQGMALILANLHAGKLDTVERWLDSVADNAIDSSGPEGAFIIGVRAEVLLARDQIDAGLSTWRTALGRINPHVGTEYRVGSSGIDPLLSEIQAATVVAHAQHGRLEQVADLVQSLPDRLIWLLEHPTVNPSPFLREFPTWGALLLAVGMTEPQPRKAARMIALAERFRFLRGFQPTMSPSRARAAAEKVAYAEAVSHYATLSLDQLRIAALDLLDR
ncbi:ATP-binding protein [Kibdelosporangium philippinense]|uniref:ATP-binding protein n=1 Tax=Kibdelosporangium philippinense TaxID=211113 RepID=UPI0024C44A82|nr:AfsR/SARP family transcriptional regulator [Kibdelosporangium philippinense]